ncbi:HGGxSTG domain-containing protein [Halomonas saccharevitans]|uniref:HGGxSTG domain-containing protein n=1 Tax=Halomonas saccharevitans TaxID=416872 RepID=UPI0036F30283
MTTDNQAELRKRYRAWTRAIARGERRPFPQECRGLRCGARTRAGTPCKRRDLFSSGRCRLHGGLSTGPKSGPRAKRPEPPTPETPFDPMDDPEFRDFIERLCRC